MLVALGLSDRAGGYREVEGASYARAEVVDGVAVFATAAGTWGVVRAFALDGGDWVALARPVMVEERQRATLDLAAKTLATEVPELPARTGSGRRFEPPRAVVIRPTRVIDRGQ